MRVIEVKSCRECPYMMVYYNNGANRRVCTHKEAGLEGNSVSGRIKTFPKFCPLKEAKDG